MEGGAGRWIPMSRVGPCMAIAAVPGISFYCSPSHSVTPRAHRGPSEDVPVVEKMNVVCRATEFEPGVDRVVLSRPVESPSSFNIGEGETTVRGVFKVLVDFE